MRARARAHTHTHTHTLRYTHSHYATHTHTIQLYCLCEEKFAFTHTHTHTSKHTSKHKDTQYPSPTHTSNPSCFLRLRRCPRRHRRLEGEPRPCGQPVVLQTLPVAHTQTGRHGPRRHQTPDPGRGQDVGEDDDDDNVPPGGPAAQQGGDGGSGRPRKCQTLGQGHGGQPDCRGGSHRSDDDDVGGYIDCGSGPHRPGGPSGQEGREGAGAAQQDFRSAEAWRGGRGPDRGWGWGRGVAVRVPHHQHHHHHQPQSAAGGINTGHPDGKAAASPRVDGTRVLRATYPAVNGSSPASTAPTPSPATHGHFTRQPVMVVAKRLPGNAAQWRSAAQHTGNSKAPDGAPASNHHSSNAVARLAAPTPDGSSAKDSHSKRPVSPLVRRRLAKRSRQDGLGQCLEAPVDEDMTQGQGTPEENVTVERLVTSPDHRGGGGGGGARSPISQSGLSSSLARDLHMLPAISTVVTPRH